MEQTERHFFGAGMTPVFLAAALGLAALATAFRYFLSSGGT